VPISGRGLDLKDEASIHNAGSGINMHCSDKKARSALLYKHIVSGDPNVDPRDSSEFESFEKRTIKNGLSQGPQVLKHGPFPRKKAELAKNGQVGLPNE